MLYTQEFIDTLPAMHPFENPWVVALCRVEAQKDMKEMIEVWYDALPEGMKLRFKDKLLSTDNAIFVAAFHELAIYRYCIEEGWNVEYEPTLDNGLTPDLLVHSKEYGDFIVEVTTLFDSEEVAKAVVRKEELTQRIAAIKTDHVLNINYSGYPQKDYSSKKLANAIKVWLDSLPDDEKVHRKTFDQNGCYVKVEASKDRKKFPRPNMGCVLVVGEDGHVPDYSIRAKRKLDEKRKKYSSKEIGIPLVVVLADGVGRMRVDSYLIDKALFGQYQVTITNDGSKPPAMTRDRSGHFTPSNDERGEWFGKNTGISAVMFSSFRGRNKFQMKVLHNPVASVEMPYGPFEKMPQLVRTEDKPHVVMRWTLGRPDNFIENDEEQEIMFKYDE